MVDVLHTSLTSAADLHEPKGALAATAKQVYVADGAASGSFQTVQYNGFWDYNDLTTASTQIPLTVAGTSYELTNDGAGSFTNLTYACPVSTNIWNVSTNRFDFSNLALGDQVDIRLDIEITTTSVNTEVGVELELGLSPGTPYSLPVIADIDLKTAKTYHETVWMGFYMGDANTFGNAGRITASASKTGVTVKVNGWYIRVTKFAP